MNMDIRKLKIPKEEIIPINTNFIFTGIFNDDSNIAAIEYLLADLTGIPFSSIKGHVKILSRDLRIENKRDKNAQVDLLLDMQGVKINIEISNRISLGVVNRNIIYGCKIHARQLHYADNTYTNIKSTIQIQLNNFRCNDETIKKSYYFRDKNGEILSTSFEIDIIDLELGKKIWYTNKNDRLARWSKILTTNKIQELREVMEEDMMDNVTREQFIEEVIKYSQDENNIALYMKLPREELERNTYIEEAKAEAIEKGTEIGTKIGTKIGKEIGKQVGEKIGRKKGLLEGFRKKQIEIAKNLKKLGIDEKTISLSTELSLDEIRQL